MKLCQVGFVCFQLLTIRLWTIDFYRIIADEGAARVIYHSQKSREINLIVLVSIY